MDFAAAGHPPATLASKAHVRLLDLLLFYEGSVWYKRSLDYAKSPKSRLFLHFGACNYLAAVYLSGEELGEHEGGFTPFDFEITDRVKAHGNFLVLRINNNRAKDQVPTVNTDWWNYGGITRPVTLVEVPALAAETPRSE